MFNNILTTSHKCLLMSMCLFAALMCTQILRRDCKMLIRLTDKHVCVCDTGGVITEGSEVKIVPFPISSYPSIDLFCQHTTPILCLLRIHTSCAECWLYLHATGAVECLQYLNKQSGVSHMWDVYAHGLYTHTEVLTNILLFRVITRHLCI